MKLFLKIFLVCSIYLCCSTTIISAQDVGTEKVLSEVEKATSENPILKAHPWLKKIIDLEKANNESIAVYSLGGKEFVIVEKDSQKIMYDSSGKVYCTNSSTLKCEEFYKLDAATDTWVNKKN